MARTTTGDERRSSAREHQASLRTQDGPARGDGKRRGARQPKPSSGLAARWFLLLDSVSPSSPLPSLPVEHALCMYEGAGQVCRRVLFAGACVVPVTSCNKGDARPLRTLRKNYSSYVQFRKVMGAENKTRGTQGLLGACMAEST